LIYTLPPIRPGANVTGIFDAIHAKTDVPVKGINTAWVSRCWMAAKMLSCRLLQKKLAGSRRTPIGY
jgi:hypothetical protein